MYGISTWNLKKISKSPMFNDIFGCLSCREVYPVVEHVVVDGSSDTHNASTNWCLAHSSQKWISNPPLVAARRIKIERG
jgi:hypothetical protein